MGPLLKFVTLETMTAIDLSSMGVRKCIVWITRWCLITMDCSFISILSLSMCEHLTWIQFVQNWHQFFAHTNDYFEYLLDDLSSMGEEMIVMWHPRRCELTFGHDLNVIHAYNKMYIGYKMRIEWKIGGLKQKWKRLMKCFDSTMPKSNHLFEIVIILTNFFHKHHLDFTYEVIGAT